MLNARLEEPVDRNGVHLDNKREEGFVYNAISQKIICVCCDVEVFGDALHGNFLVLRCDEQRCDTKQLKVFPSHVLLLTEAINDVDGDVESLHLQFKLQVHFYEP